MKAESVQILLVEDNPDEVTLIREQLLHSKNNRFHISAVGRLDEALAQLAKQHFNLIMLDLILPDSRGPDTFTTIHQQFPDVPIIVLTCMEDETLALRLVQEGAQDYLVKGEGPTSLLSHAVRYALERHTVRQTSQEALKRLRELNETKSQFVAEVSHEIRTPLAIIREFVSLVRDEVIGPLNDKQRNYLDSALRNCDRLANLINQILDLAKIESGKAELHRTKVDLPALLMQFRNDALMICQSKKQTLTLEVPESLPTAHCDVTSVQHILINLLGNAHKFTPEGGTITIRACEAGQFLRVDVADNGPGIPVEAQSAIFEAFVQVNRQDGPGAKGTGLGLKIAKNLVQLNGGLISVASKPGQGSCFSFTLPMYDKELPARILIVDDERPVGLMIEKALQFSDLKVEVKSTVSGLDALLIAGEFRPNLVILDVHLAEVGGEQVLVSLKQQNRQHNCKVLLISGDMPLLNDVTRMGADDCLAKPFKSKQLLDKIQILLELEPKTYPEPMAAKVATGVSA